MRTFIDTFNSELVEATLSEYDKVQQWEMGVRKENVRAMGNPKLQRYYDIALDNDFLYVATQCEKEAKLRVFDLIIPTQRAHKLNDELIGDIRGRYPYYFISKDFSSWASNILGSATDANKAYADYLASKANGFSQVAAPLMKKYNTYSLLKDPDDPDGIISAYSVVVVYLLFALAENDTKAVADLKNILLNCHMGPNLLKQLMIDLTSYVAIMQNMVDGMNMANSQITEDLAKGRILEDTIGVSDLSTTTPYMLRNDGRLLVCGDTHPYIKMFYNDSNSKNLQSIMSHMNAVQWFYENTNKESTRTLIIKFLTKLNCDEGNGLLARLTAERVECDDSLTDLFDELNDATNQEFCRVRTSNFKYKYGGDNGEIYFRISSVGFNWFDAIWNVVSTFSHRIKYVTVMKDYATFGKQFDYLSIKGQEVNKMPIVDFLSLPGEPMLEQIMKEFCTDDLKGQKLKETYGKTLTDIVPSQAEADYIVSSMFAYEANKSDTVWCKKHFLLTPWGIAWNVSPSGRVNNAETAMRYYLVAVMINWAELVTQLTRTLKQTLKIDKAEMQNVMSLLQGSINTITNEVNQAMRAVTKLPESLTICQALRWLTKTTTKATESLTENIEKHEELNQKLWTKDNTLKPEVEEKVNAIVDEFANELKADEIELKVKDIVIIGSNASYNYTEDSDVDIHVIADIKADEKLLPKVYSAYRSLFNKKLDIDFYNIPVELFVETNDTPTVSNGVYSVKNKKWLREPVAEDIPDIDVTKFSNVYADWESKCKEALNSDETTPEDIDKVLEDVYDLRKKGLQGDGEYSIENLVFKELRNNGYLDGLKDRKNELISDSLSLN